MLEIYRGLVSQTVGCSRAVQQMAGVVGGGEFLCPFMCFHFSSTQGGTPISVFAIGPKYLKPAYTGIICDTMCGQHEVTWMHVWPNSHAMQHCTEPSVRCGALCSGSESTLVCAGDRVINPMSAAIECATFQRQSCIMGQ